MSRANRVSLLHDSRSLISRDYGTVAILMPARLRQSDFYYSIAVNRAQTKKQKTNAKKQNGFATLISLCGPTMTSSLRNPLIPTMMQLPNCEMRGLRKKTLPTSKIKIDPHNNSTMHHSL